MHLLYAKYEDIAIKIRENNSNVVVYGAGMIGSILIPYIIEKYDFFNNLLFYVDGDKNKQNKKIRIGRYEYDVRSTEALKSLPENIIVLISNSNYAPIVKMLDEMRELDNVEGYIIPIVQVCNTHEKKKKYCTRVTKEQVIPKKIYYCWFSRNPMPDYLKKCIETWYKFCPDYEIIRWDEDNYDINKNGYMQQAYAAQKWGFVPDVARLDILYQHGGIYLDTDVELVRNLDDLLYQPAFAGVEKWGSINMGGCSGAIPHHPIIKRMLDFRANESFLMEDGSFNQTTCGYYETMPLIGLGFNPDNSIQIIEGMTIYSSDFFHPYDYMSGETTLTDNTFSIHQFNGGWLDENSLRERKKTFEEYRQMLDRMRVGINE